MSPRVQVVAGDYSGPPYKSREACFTVMRNKTKHMDLEDVPHCHPDWDQLSRLCWGPTLPGTVAQLPCPDDGFLNPHQNATRTCHPNATWYVNHTFDDKPYTNFYNCFLSEVPTAEDDLKKLVSTKVITILKALDDYRNMYLTCHVVSIALLVAAVVMCLAVVLKLKKKHQASYTYALLAAAGTVLLVNHLVSISTSAVHDASQVFKCRLAKALVLFSTLVFYECLFGYLYFCIVPILKIVIRRLLLKIAIVSFLTAAAVLVLAETFMEIFTCPNPYCGFRTFQSTYHWLTTAPRFLLVMSIACLDVVTLFGSFCLKQPHLEKGCDIWHIRQKGISALCVALHAGISEILLVLLHTEAYLHYSQLPVQDYFQAYSLVIAIQGTVFAVILCFMDLEVLCTFGLPMRCVKSYDGSHVHSHQEEPTFSASEGQFSHNKRQCDLAHQETAEERMRLSDPCEIELMSKMASAEDETEIQPQIYESKLNYGPLKYT